MATRTAVVAGTATAVSGRVARRQAARYQEQQAPPQQYAQPQYAQPEPQYAPPAAAPPAEDESMAQLQKLSTLHAQGVLTDEEFAAAKAKVLGI